MLSKTSHVQKPVISCSCSFVEPRSKMMMMIIMGHKYKRGTCLGEESVGGGRGNVKDIKQLRELKYTI